MQNENAQSPILVRLLGNSILFKPVFIQNTLYPILFTPFGIVTAERGLLHFNKTPSPTIIKSEPLRSSQEVPINAPFPILFTELGMVTLKRFVQPLKASMPILVTLLGIVTRVRLVLRLNKKSLITLTPSGMDRLELVPL